MYDLYFGNDSDTHKYFKCISYDSLEICFIIDDREALIVITLQWSHVQQYV